MTSVSALPDFPVFCVSITILYTHRYRMLDVHNDTAVNDIIITLSAAIYCTAAQCPEDLQLLLFSQVIRFTREIM